MKILALIARAALGLVFVVFSLNYWGHFLEVPMPEGENAQQFMGAIAGSGFLTVVKVLELVGGILVLSVRFTPLGLLLLGPIVVCINLYHLTMDPAGLPLAIVIGAAALFLAWRHGDRFAGFFQPAKAG